MGETRDTESGNPKPLEEMAAAPAETQGAVPAETPIDPSLAPSAAAPAEQTPASDATSTSTDKPLTKEEVAKIEELAKIIDKKNNDHEKIRILSWLGAGCIIAAITFFSSDYFQNWWSNSQDYSPRSEYSQQLKERVEELKKKDLNEFSGVTLEDYVIDGVKVGAEKRTYPEPDFKDKKLTGDSFYVKGTSASFETRIKDWMNYLDVAYLLPNIEGMSAYEVGNLLQKIGEDQIKTEINTS